MKVLILGGGIAGYTAAIKAAQNKFDVTLVEKAELGGTCLNRGCIPTKSFLHDSEMVEQVRKAKEHGFFDSVPHVNPQAIMDRKNEVVERLRKGIASLLKANKIRVIEDTVKFVNSHTVMSSQGEELSGDVILLATGSEPRRLPLPNADHPRFWTSDDCFLHMPTVPSRIVLIGGGVIGVELASFYRSLGHTVTIVEMEKRILPPIDRDAAMQLQSMLKKHGVTLLLNSKVKEMNLKEDHLEVIVEVNGVDTRLVSDYVIQSVGRKANLSIQPEIAGIEVERGVVKTNDYYQTNIPHIYAIGDLNGKSWLAHGAAAQAKAAIEHILNPTLPAKSLISPSVVYSEPQIAQVGLDEESAKSNGIPYLSGKFLVSGNGKHVVEGQDRGFIKILTNEHHVILGATIFSTSASEMIPYITQAIVTKQTVHSLEDVIFPHPTLSEAMEDAFGDVLGLAIHSLPKVR